MEENELYNATVPSFSGIEPAFWNYSDHVILDDLKMDSSFIYLLCSLVSAISWIIYIAYYNSRVIGYILTKLLNRFVIRDGYVKVGSFTLSALSGKIMFRDIVYITTDYSIRVQDGWLIFRWWRSYVPKDVSEDLSHSDTRLSVMLNGFELHVYNRCQLYAQLEKAFGLTPQMFSDEEDHTVNIDDRDPESYSNAACEARQQINAMDVSRHVDNIRKKEAHVIARTWRDLIPVIKLDVSTGRLVFGNRLVPTTLSITVEEAHFVYSTKPAASRHDHFMHFTKCKAENFKVILAPSPKYTGMVDDPPRYMGEGFVVLSSNNMEVYYYMDEPGFVPEHPEMIQLVNGDMVEAMPPIWGIDVKCGKGTDFSYGPWADRQREHLFKFFFPNDYQPLKVTKSPVSGEKRQVQSFDIRLSTLNEATIDILFSKNRETNAVHINVGPGSYLEITMPWIVLQDGYTTKITGQLLHLEATTSLQYRSLVESETLEFGVKCHYPIRWNDHQEWTLNLTGCKATANLVYSHKEFFQDMINDWASKARPDILHFVPYTWKFNLLLKEFELITLCNEYNWIDCSSQNQENAHIAFCGEFFELSFDLPFVDYLPVTIPLRFWIQGESVDLSFYLPEVNTSRTILLALNKNAKIMTRDGSHIYLSELNKTKKWRNVCQKGAGWVDCWSVPIVALSINYTYHPCPPLGPTPQANITTPEKEEILLSPMRIPRCRKSPGLRWTRNGSQKFDPQSIAPDKVSLDLEIGSSILIVYGSLLKNFIHLKENLFGDYQTFTDMQQSRTNPTSISTERSKDKDVQNSSIESVEDEDAKSKSFDPRDYRPLEVTVGITMHDIQAHLVKNCGENDPPCPVIILERFGFEMNKRYKETELQLLLSPAIALVTDNVVRSSKERHLNQGHLMLSALQVRGHAMFSNEGRSLDQETLEYAWLIEVQLGKLTGKMSSPQLHHLITSLETFLLMVKNNENSLRPPDLPHHCHHGIPPLQCPDSDIDNHYRCPSSEDIKYRMTRIAIDAVDLYFQEVGTTVHLWISPIRVSTCNLHGQQVKSGVTGVLPRILIRQFVSVADHFANTSNTNTTGSGRSHNNASSRDGSDIWLEVGSVALGPVILEAAISLPTPEHNLHLVQNKYLKLHDEATKRLWFLWPQESGIKPTKCGCIGGCAFFGNNRNGPRFFKPNYHDFQDGINVAAYRINESGKEKGFGQSILHDGQLVFHTSPYNLQDVSLQDHPVKGKLTTTQDGSHTSKKGVERPRSVTDHNKDSGIEENSSKKLITASASPFACSGERKLLGRRFSYTSMRGNSVKDVPYSRLVDASPVAQLPQKLDSDSKLHTERSKSILNVPEIEAAPKSSVSDSKLAVDYFNASDGEPFESNSPQSLPIVSTETNLSDSMQTSTKTIDGITISDSRHSLYIKSESDEKLKKEVQRTISMSSENHSEAFYSADEDTSHGLSGSRTSSLRQSIVGSGSVLARNDSMKKKFSSDLSIVESSANVNAPVSEKAHTLERTKPQTISTKRSPRVNRNTSFQNDIDSNENGGLRDSSDSHSVSSTSFISAVSSQEDVTLVNLHMQVNKPIVDSPLLLSSYVSHLTQVRCSNWSQSSITAGGGAFTTPLFQRTEDGRLVYVGGRYVPKFETVTEGFTSLKMITRSDGSPVASSSNKTPTHPYLWDSATLNQMEGEEDHTAHNEEELLTVQHESGSRTTIIVKFKGDVDIMLSPMVLESLQRFIDAIIPTLATLHPLTILNHLHHECIGKVEDANILKQDQSLSYWGQVQTSSKRSTAEKNIKNGQGDDKRKIALQTNVYEESIMTQIQGSIILPKMNITLLQASVVEEIISFSALENIRDLTCVSLFAVCFDDVTARFYIGKQAREVVQTFHKPVVLPNQKKVNKISKAFLPGHQTAAVVADIGSGETVYIETSEKQQEEIVVTLNIGKAHSQLRRLRNESSILKDAVITAIPAHYSRVLFTCTRITSPLKCVDYYLHQFMDDKEKCKQTGPPQATEEFTLGSGEDRLGFIMFECGLEGIKLKVLKRSQFETGENGSDNKKVDAELFYTDSVKSQEELDNATASTAPAAEPETTSTNVPNGAQINTSATCASLASKAGNGNTVSCIIELKTIWFNFAAPPRTPITRKIDYTRLDWNLLSTASPAINAWMNPSNKFAMRIVHMFRTMYRRSTAIVACLMAEALDVQAIHMPAKSRYGRLTPLAKTLQEDPSCQLCTILQNYVLLNDLIIIEANLKESDLPLLSTLRQGVIVLSRQWKNVLYTPLLLEHNYKTKHVKPLNVTFAVSDPDEENLLTDGEGSAGEVDDQEVTDECAMLIHTDHMHKHTHVKSGQEKTTGYGTLREEKTPQIHISHSHQLGSNPSIYSGGGHGSQHSTGSLDQVTSPTSHHSNKPLNTGEDLYSWMAKQQEFIKDNEKGNLKGNWDSKINTMTTDDTEDSDVHSGTLLYPMKDSLRLLDAHLIFEPLLSSLSVMPQQMLSAIGSGNVNNVSSLESLGSNLSLVGSMETMRIDIVVSEFGKLTDKKKGNKYQTKKGNKFHLDIPPETPAFLCEKIGIDIDVKKMADMTVDDMIQKQTVLYISRGQLKKHTSTVVNFSLNIRYISQQVNMPLLRLLHQISNMYQNVKETQMELKEQQPESKRNNNLIVNDTAVKNGSSSTSDLQEQLLLGGKKMDVPLLRNSFEPDISKVTSPGMNVRSRPQSFAQKLCSTGKSVKGYINLSEGVITPNFGASPSGSGLDKFCVLPDKRKDTPHMTPRCWKTIYYLLDLYATRPETKTITHRFSIPADASEQYKSGRKYELLNETKDADIEKGLNAENSSTPVPLPRELSIVTGERTRLIIFGVARIHRTRLLATLSGLKLEAEITSLHASLTCRKKSKPASLECSLTGQIGRTMIVLLEGVAPSQQTVVRVTVGKSQALYSSISRRQKDKNSGLLTVGAVNIDIPQHPVALHGMMTRGSKQLSSTLQELRVTRTSSRMSRGQQQDEADIAAPGSPHHYAPAPSVDLEKPQVVSSLLEPIVMQFNIILQSLSITAALLPSLQAQYKMDQVTSSGITGSKAKFTIDLPHHTLSFTTKLQVIEANLPSEASIELPKVHVSAEYIQDGSSNMNDSKLADGVVLRQGSYLSATADIGTFEHSLTTDLLNHLVFVQKVFMKEVNEVVQKVYGGEKPVPLWLEDEEPNNTTIKRILFSLIIRIKRIQLTATTPTNSAVRLETGAVELQLSNRVQNVFGATQPNPYMKLFGKAQVDINLSLGQLLKNVLFEEAEPEFQQFAFFNTRVGLRNAFREEMAQGEDKEVVLITLKRPLIYVQPVAIDKAILVWLNYKNAYEYWNEKRANLNKEVLTATQQVFEKVPFGQITSQLSAPHLGTLFLQLTVDDMGICLPLNPLPPTWGMNRGLYDGESRDAVVVTLENTSISACSSGSLVSKGRFMGLCLRFAEDFETSLDDWKPDTTDSSIMNLCIVSEGTYEVCSRTIAQKQDKSDNAKWILNVQWQMEGVDIHLDVNVGQQLSALGHTLTMLTGSEEDDIHVPADYDSDDADQPDNSTSQVKKKESILMKKSKNWTDSLPAFVFDPTLDAKKRSKLIEKEMNEQAKIINDLRSLGASHGTIEQEMKRLHELEAMVFKDFRRDMIQKLRRQSVKASGIKGKLGLGGKPNTYRSRSFIVPSPTLENQLESPEDLNMEVNSANSASYESSPRSGPSRSASLRVRGLSGPRVTFSDTHTMGRQSSLPSAGSELSLPEGELEWPETIEIEGERVELRKKNRDISCTSSYDSMEGNAPLLDSFGKEQSSSTSSPYVTPQKTQEPNIDFELDVKVLINSGKCVLHTKDPGKDDEIKIMSRMKKERSCSGGTFEFQPSSPSSSRKHLSSKEKSSTTSTSRLRYLQHTNVPLVDLTIFHIPGLDVKVHYESKTLPEESMSPRVSSENSTLNPSSTTSLRKSSTKKASLFAWMTLQSIPEETIISPHILEFLEQTLEPIPSKTSFHNTVHTNAVFPLENTESTSWAATAASSSNYVYASFPVDVIVYFHMQPSTFRFSCLPVSRVECMLQLPSLDIVFSSKRAEEELIEFREYKSPGIQSSGKEASSAIGGLSVTGCLADFSVYIFHPYGGGKKTGLKEAQWSPLSDSERKDSLSINVEFVKFHMSRSRKINFHSELSKKMSDTSRAVIRFSTIVDIGSASFKYDMRRLSEILAFPKAWYRRSIMRRLFLGDLSSGTAYSEGDCSPSLNQDEAVIGSSLLKHYDRHGTDGLSKSAPERSPTLNRDKLRLSLESDIPRHARLKDIGRGWSFTSDKQTSSEVKLREAAWETLVLFAINFTRLNVHMNMSNVMGNVTWMAKDFRSDGRLSIGSTGHKNLYISVGLGGSSLDAKGGIVGGTIELSKIDTFIHIREEPGIEPDHTLGLRLFALELRLDYMGTSVLMSRVSSLDVSLKDEWKINRSNSGDAFMPTRRPAIIFMHGDLGWDQLQVMISKSTTADLLKMYYKLDEFSNQQFKSSKRVFSSLQPKHQRVNNSSFRKRQMKHRSTCEGPCNINQTTISDARHHRHWQGVLAQVAGLQLGSLRFSLPSTGTVLGGTMELHGCNISLACFHGINFKSKSWALFSLKEPCISFATEAQEIPSVESPNTCDVHVVQTLTISLGQQQEQHARHHSMATVCRLSRSLLFPPQFKSLQEWFHYAFASSEIDAVDRFPCVERERTDSTSDSGNMTRGRSTSTTSGKLQEHSHAREVIFALPSLQLHLKTEHLQTAKTPDVIGEKPLVECSFITEFEDHIFVTVDAEAFFFLHDLITSYVKEEMDMGGHSTDLHGRRSGTASTANSFAATSITSEDEKKRKQFDPSEMFIKDWRSYRCKTWHLEPTVRLLSWAGKSIEPYGIDYILQKLGFSHARTTIPKWIQRGFMDPLDKLLAILMLRMVSAVREESPEEQKEHKRDK
ncbi:transmembrane protein KIAA1109 isoform X1 [Colletes gigas]|uniref:transmembrane protein KIAA1109 isoform X1 n=1 Tax=Colletes gigas TaxID=935657 RepID=UPI001C9B2643|nr:transmembrane protein KIAA1109 isoform X1 [Colletes gigas]